MAPSVCFVALMRALCNNGAQTAPQLSARLNYPVDETQKALEELRDIYGVVTVSAEQWHLNFVPQWLCRASLAAALPQLNVILKDETIGTNELAKAGDNGDIFFTEYQTQGRGRYHRRWLAVPGGALLMSLRVAATSPLSGFSLAIGAALWQAFGGTAGKLRLKWPNDLLNDKGQKVGGILIETAGADVIIGVGINWMITPQLAAQVSAAALASELSRQECAVLAATAIVRAAADFANHGLARFLPTVLAAHYCGVGDKLSFWHGEEEKRGSFVGFADDGGLLIDNGGIQHYVAGEIRHVVGG